MVDVQSVRVKPGEELGIRVGQNTFDDIDYADDGALLPAARVSAAALLQRFDEEAGHLGKYHGQIPKSKTLTTMWHSQRSLSVQTQLTR